MRNVLVCFDSFKGCLASAEAGEAAREGLLEAHPDWHVEVLPMADGGEGTAEVMRHYLGGEWIPVRVHDALMRPVEADILMLPDGSTAVVELAKACGLAQLSPEERDAVNATTYGFGEMIAEAIRLGARHVICTLGGSATNDAGLGAIQAISESRLCTMNDALCTDKAQYTVLCDADIPFRGPDGAVALYSTQKGATVKDQTLLEARMDAARDFIIRKTGVDPDTIPGAGAAGGTCAALIAFLNARPVSGAEFILDVADFDDKVRKADLVITGEGCSDRQTLQGKAPMRILERTKRLNPDAEVCLLSGRIENAEVLRTAGFRMLEPINNPDTTTARQIIRSHVQILRQ